VPCLERAIEENLFQPPFRPDFLNEPFDGVDDNREEDEEGERLDRQRDRPGLHLGFSVCALVGHLASRPVGRVLEAILRWPRLAE
jgi:hypothetical protein